MAVYKRGNVYWFEFVWKEQRIRQSTKQGNKRLAIQIEAVRRTQLAKGEVGIKDPPKKESPVVLRRVVEQSFLPHVRTKFAAKPKTLEYYENGAKQLLGFSKLATKALISIGGDEIDQYAEHRRAKGRQISTVNRELQVLRRILRWAEETKKVDQPLAKVTLLPGENERDRVITREEERLYLMAAPPLLKDVATVILDCGLRPEECFRLKWNNIRDGAIYNSFGKTKAARRRIPMTARVAEIADRRQEEADSVWVFPAPTRSGHMESSSIRRQQARVFRLTNIEQFVLYSLRHTCLTRWAPHMDAYTLAYLAGHEDMETTKRYVHPEDETVKNAFEQAQKLPSLPRSPHSSPHRPATGKLAIE